MRRRLLIGAIIGVAVAACFWLAWPAAKSPVAQAGLVLDAEEYDFGQAWMTDRFHWVLPVRNTSGEAIKVSKIVSAAGGQAIQLDDWTTLIPAHDGLGLGLTLDLTSFESHPAKARAASRKVWIDARIVLEGSKQTIPFRLRGRVRMPFLLEPPKLDLGEVVLGRGPIEARVVKVTTIRPMKKLVAANPVLPTVGIDGSPLVSQNQFSVADVSVHRVGGRSKRWEVAVQPGKKLREGRIRFTIYLEAPGSGLPALPLAVVGHARSELRALPSAVAFGVQQSGSTTRETLTLVSMGGVPMRLKSVQVTGDGLSIERSDSSESLRLNHELELTFHPTEPGNLLGTVGVTAEAADGTAAECTIAVQGYAAGKVRKIKIRRGKAAPIAEIARIQADSPRPRILPARPELVEGVRSPAKGANPATKALADKNRVQRIRAAWASMRRRSPTVECKVSGSRFNRNDRLIRKKVERSDSSIELEREWLIDLKKPRYVVEHRTQTTPYLSSRTLPSWYRHVFDGALHQTRDLAVANFPSLFRGRRELSSDQFSPFSGLDWGLFLSVGTLPPLDGHWIPPALASAMQNSTGSHGSWGQPNGDFIVLNRFRLQGHGMVGGQRCAVVRRELSIWNGQMVYDDLFVDEDAGCIIRRWQRCGGGSIRQAIEVDYAKKPGEWSPIGWAHTEYNEGKLQQAESVKVIRWNSKARFNDLTFRHAPVRKVIVTDNEYAANMGGQRSPQDKWIDEEIARRRAIRPAPGTSRVGIGVVAVGLAVFYWWTRRRKRAL